MPAMPETSRSLALWFPDLTADRSRRSGHGMVSDTTFLALLCRWAARLSLRVKALPPDALLVDLADCTLPFGDEPGLLAEVGDRCLRLGLTVCMAVADTPGAAWALACHGSEDRPAVTDRIVPFPRPGRLAGPHTPQARIAPPGTLDVALAPLPVAGLRLPDDTLVALQQMGLRRIGDLTDLPRAALARRFGATLVLRLDQAFGRAPEPIEPVRRMARSPAGGDTALADLIRLLDAALAPGSVTRLHPADSRIPEKAALVLAAAWSEPWPAPWPAPPGLRPIVLHAPEPLDAAPDPMPPAQFGWRRADHALRQAAGPERIAPEWWLDDPHWRTGPRDYWRVETATGDRLWLYYAHGGAVPGGWFCQGRFA